jgi:hypothetical protein
MVASTSLWRPGLNPRILDMVFVMNEITLRHIFLRALVFSLPILHTDLPSTDAATLGHSVPYYYN